VISGIMGLVGAIIGGAFSYLGNQQGARHSYKLSNELEQRTAKRRLGRVLEFTFIYA